MQNRKYKFFYHTEMPKFSNSDKEMFSQKGYECKAVMRDRKGRPVAVLKSTDKDLPVWKVQYGFSTVVFKTYEEAIAFCNGRFSK